MRNNLPSPLPQGLLAQVTRECGLLLCLDYDGTLAEIADEPAAAAPYAGVAQQLRRLALKNDRLTLAILTGRKIREVKTLLGVDDGIFFSGVHGLELEESGSEPRLAPEAVACTSELAAVRGWLEANVPPNQGFKIEDKGVALGLHYRLAGPVKAHALQERFTQFVTRETPHLKVVSLKMLVEAMPRVASKANALRHLKMHTSSAWVTAFLGDDVTDEDGFAALDQEDIGVLIGAERPSMARYRLDGPADVARELRLLAEALANV